MLYLLSESSSLRPFDPEDRNTTVLQIVSDYVQASMAQYHPRTGNFKQKEHGQPLTIMTWSVFPEKNPRPVQQTLVNTHHSNPTECWYTCTNCIQVVEIRRPTILLKEVHYCHYLSWCRFQELHNVGLAWRCLGLRCYGQELWLCSGKITNIKQTVMLGKMKVIEERTIDSSQDT